MTHHIPQRFLSLAQICPQLLDGSACVYVCVVVCVSCVCVCVCVQLPARVFLHKQASMHVCMRVVCTYAYTYVCAISYVL